MFKKIGLFLASIAPGIFMVGYNIGTGSITTIASSGAAYGMALVWPLLLSCVFTFYLMLVFGRYTSITGNTILYSFKIHFGSGISMFVLLSLLIGEWVACMGVMAVVTQVVEEWSRPLTRSGNGFNPLYTALFLGALLYYFFWNGKHRIFEKILAVFVGIMGTTMGVVIFVARSILVHEKGWTKDDLKQERKDAIISASLMFILSVSIMAAAAGTLHPLGLKVENAIDMVKLLEPLAGRFAISIFVAGIICAGLSSLFPIILLAPWFFADFRNKPRKMRSSGTRLLVLFAVSLGLVVPVFGGKPVMVMIVSQSLGAIVSPLALILLFLLYNKKKLMGEFSANMTTNIMLGIITVFTILMALAGVIGILNLLK